MTRNSALPLGLALGLLALAACGEATAPEPAGPVSPSEAGLAEVRDTWVSRAAMPREVYCCAAVAVTPTATGSVLYVMGGLNSTGATARVQAYDVARNRWSVKAPAPRALDHTNGAAVIRGKIYVSGGRTFVSDGVNSRDVARAFLFMYDPATNAWTTRARMPAPTEGGVTEVIKNELYVLTGCGPNTTLDCNGPQIPVVFYRYSPLSDRWTTLPTPPTPFAADQCLRPGHRSLAVQGSYAHCPGDHGCCPCLCRRPSQDRGCDRLQLLTQTPDPTSDHHNWQYIP